jgi:ABC-type branched-subunit amino acid transport system ATPase component
MVLDAEKVYELTCQGLVKSFDGICALNHLDLKLPPSGIVAIIGPNGAGKTTLINVLTGFLHPDIGTCFLGPREITRLAPHQVSQLGIARTFQDLRLIGRASLVENIMLACRHQRGEALLGALFRFGVAKQETLNRQRAMDLLALVGLADKAHQLAGQLSYGQQKLLTLACCLATEARILLLDEPVAGVHPEMISRILNLLRKLRDENKLIVFIEHDMSAVREAAEVVIVMDHGKLIAQGDPTEVLERPEILEAYLA